jgi:predicted cupin superfamily sugar epimerase
VTSDETWHYVEGAPLELFRVDAAFSECERMLVGSLADGAEPARVVPAGHWQAARTTGTYTLVSCAVGPGFDFADFAMLADHPTDAEHSIDPVLSREDIPLLDSGCLVVAHGSPRQQAGLSRDPIG